MIERHRDYPYPHGEDWKDYARRLYASLVEEHRDRNLDFTRQDEFTEMTDTPSDYTGDADKFLVVNDGETAVEFSTQLSETTNGIKITGATDTITLTHDNTNAYVKWNDGSLILTTDEGTNTDTIVDIRGKGTGVGQQIILDEDEQEWLFSSCVNGNGILRVNGSAPGELRIGAAANYASFEQDGEINLVGTARALRDIWLPFNGMKAPGTKPATFKEWGISGVWEFSDGTDDTIVANIKFPNDMDMTVAPSVALGWSTNTAVVTETARWQLEYLYTAPGEDTTAAAQATISVDSDAVAQADGLVVATFPAMAVPSATDVCVHCRIKRLGAVDDLTDTAELHGMCMSYTSNKLGTAT